MNILPKLANIGFITSLMTLVASSSGCAYRFSNIAMKRPVGVRTIAFEGIYDTTRDVVPSQIIWAEIQKAFARNGKLAITSVDQADAIMVAQITAVQSNPENINREQRNKDPKGEDVRNINPADPEIGFKNLMKAGRWTSQQMVGFSLNINVWRLDNRQMIFTRSYAIAGPFHSFRPTETVSQAGQFLSFEENRNTTFRRFARQISSRIVSDFFL